MPRTHAVRLGLCLAVLGSLFFFPLAADEGGRARDILAEEMSAAGSIEGQAIRMTELIWPDEGTPDPEIAALARVRLVNYGNHAFPALLHAARRIRPLYSADLLTALLEARLQVPSGVPNTLLATMDTVVWFGSPEGKRLAIREVAKRRFANSLLACIDAAYEHPELVPTVVRSMGTYRNERSRFFLDEMLHEGLPEERRLAAEVLASIRGDALELLRKAVLSDEASVREVAVTALLSVASVDDLTTLHEYAALHPDDDPATLAEVRQRAIELEALFERQQTAEASTSEDF